MDRTLQRSSEQLYRFVADVKDYAIFLLDAQGHVASWNAGAELIKGYRSDEIIGQHFSKFYTEEAVARRWPQYELEVASQVGRFEDEGWRVRKDGTQFWANVIITALHDSDGALQGFSKITRDLTDRRRQEEQLRLSEERFRLLIEGVRDYAIYMLDTNGNVASWNSGAECIKGYKADEIIGQHFSKFYPPEAIAERKPELELTTAAAEGRFEDEGWRVRKDGVKFWANVVVTALRDSAGVLHGFSKITRDLTERKHAEQRLLLANAELEQRVKDRTGELREMNAALIAANGRKDEFLAILAHELRNPLAPIRTGLEVLKLAGDDRAMVEETRGVMEQQLEQMVRLIDDLLEASRLTRGKLRLRKERVELAASVKNAIESVRPAIEELAHALTVHMPAEPIYLDVDPVRLAQIFSNLLSNAAKYTERGGRITVTAERQGSEAVVTVADTGIGIAPDHLPSVFDMFSQVESALERSRGGLGIGLSLVRGLVDMHGGSVEARSEGLGRGSQFVVRLPIEPLSDAAPQATAASGDPAIRGSNCRILLADDNKDAARILERVLTLLGHEVYTAHDGQEAVQMAATVRPRMVLLDIGMPKMNGYEAARAIRDSSWGRDMVLVAVTGWGQEEDKRRAKEAGFDHHLTKPIEAAVVQKIVTELSPHSSRWT